MRVEAAQPPTEVPTNHHREDVEEEEDGERVEKHLGFLQERQGWKGTQITVIVIVIVNIDNNSDSKGFLQERERVHK